MRVRYKNSPELEWTVKSEKTQMTLDEEQVDIYIGQPSRQCSTAMTRGFLQPVEGDEITRLYILFNPWNDIEAVYRSKEELLKAITCWCGCGKKWVREDWWIESWGVHRRAILDGSVL